jgi:hypothetical protein
MQPPWALNRARPVSPGELSIVVPCWVMRSPVVMV